MATEASQPLKISLAVSAALAQAVYNEAYSAGVPAQYTFVCVNASGQADLIANNTDVPIGVLQNRPCQVALGSSQVAGPAAEIVVIGMTKVRAGGTITLGATTPGNSLKMSVASSHIGTVLQASAVTGGSLPIVGQAFAAASSGDLVKAVVSCVQAPSIGS